MAQLVEGLAQRAREIASEAEQRRLCWQLDLIIVHLTPILEEGSMIRQTLDGERCLCALDVHHILGAK